MRQIPKSFILAGFAWAVLFSSASAAPIRQWVDSTGTFTLKAELVEVKDGNVRLKKEDGSEITVAVSKLSTADQAYVAVTSATAPAPAAPASMTAEEQATAQAIRELLPRATSDEPAIWEIVAAAGTMPMVTSRSRKNQSLTLLVLANNLPVAGDGLRYFGLLEPRQLVKAVSGSVDKGYSTLFQPDVIKEVRCRRTGAGAEGVGAEGNGAEGAFDFEAKNIAAGTVEFSAEKQGDNWRITEFRVPALRTSLQLGPDGNWKLTEPAEPMPEKYGEYLVNLQDSYEIEGKANVSVQLDGRTYLDEKWKQAFQDSWKRFAAARRAAGQVPGLTFHTHGCRFATAAELLDLASTAGPLRLRILPYMHPDPESMQPFDLTLVGPSEAPADTIIDLTKADSLQVGGQTLTRDPKSPGRWRDALTEYLAPRFEAGAQAGKPTAPVTIRYAAQLEFRQVIVIAQVCAEADKRKDPLAIRFVAVK